MEFVILELTRRPFPRNRQDLDVNFTRQPRSLGDELKRAFDTLQGPYPTAQRLVRSGDLNCRRYKLVTEDK